MGRLGATSFIVKFGAEHERAWLRDVASERRGRPGQPSMLHSHAPAIRDPSIERRHDVAIDPKTNQLFGRRLLWATLTTVAANSRRRANCFDLFHQFFQPPAARVFRAMLRALRTRGGVDALEVLLSALRSR